MDDIKVKKSELLAVLKRNRDRHRDIFLKAQEGYRAQAVAELDAMLAEAKAGKRIRRALALVEPMDQTRDYDRAIRMMEMETRDEIELDQHQFAQLVMDDWGWREQFAASTNCYVPKFHDKK